MKQHFLTLLWLFVFAPLFSQVGIGTTNPDPNAILEVSSSSKGLLLPRVALVATDDPAPLADNVEGMAVYNTASSGSGSNLVTPGFYVKDGNRWIRLADEIKLQPVDKTDDEWVNASGRIEIGKQSDGTTARTSGTEFVALDNGNVGIALSDPVERLQVQGSFGSTFEYLAPDNNLYHSGFYSENNAFGSGSAGTLMATIRGDSILDPLNDSFSAVMVSNEVNLVSFTDGVFGGTGAASTMAIRENSTDIDVENRTDGYRVNLSLDAFQKGKVYLSANKSSDLYSNFSLEADSIAKANIFVGNNITGVFSRLTFDTGTNENINLSTSNNNRNVHSGLDINTIDDGYLNLCTSNNTSEQYSRITLNNSVQGQIELR